MCTQVAAPVCDDPLEEEEPREPALEEPVGPAAESLARGEALAQTQLARLVKVELVDLELVERELVERGPEPHSAARRGATRRALSSHKSHP